MNKKSNTNRSKSFYNNPTSWISNLFSKLNFHKYRRPIGSVQSKTILATEFTNYSCHYNCGEYYTFLVDSIKTPVFMVVSLVESIKTPVFRVVSLVEGIKTPVFRVVPLVESTKTPVFRVVSLVEGIKTPVFRVVSLVESIKTPVFRVVSLVKGIKTPVFRVVPLVESMKTLADKLTLYVAKVHNKIFSNILNRYNYRNQFF